MMKTVHTARLTILAALITSLVSPVFADDYLLSSRREGNASYQYFPSPADWRDVNMYQLFTDRFFDGNTGNNNIRGWYTTDGYRHYAMGGDWAGIRMKLDYLQGMGVNAIWISGVQINEQGVDTRYAPYHAYHPTDFYRVEPMFGTFQELKDLIDDAHSRGIYVIIDVVINHMADLAGLGGGKDDYYHPLGGGNLFWWTGKTHAWPLNDLKYFHNNGKITDWNDYWQTQNGAFIGTDDLKTEDPFVQQHLTAAFKNLIDATDCDGFRVDAIKHVAKDDFMMPWADAMRKHAAWLGKSNFILFGENFNYDDGAVAEHCRDEGYAFNSALYFPMQATLKNVFAYEQGTRQITDRRNNLHLYGEGANNLVTFMDNHDVDRISLESGDAWEAKLKPALTFLYTGTPVPCLFYGTEHGFNQGGQRNNGIQDGDYQREVMFHYGYQPGNAWGDKFHESALYNHIKALNEFRRDYPALTRGTFTTRWDENSKGIYAYTRSLDDQEALVVINTDWGNRSCTPQVGKPDGTTFFNLFDPDEQISVSGGTLNVNVGSKGSKIFIAGGGGSKVSTSCDRTFITISYEIGEGPLTNAAGPIHIGLGHDGNQNIIDRAMIQNGDAWEFTYALSNMTTDITFWFFDESAPEPMYDNNDGDNWVVDITDCGKTGINLDWVGAVTPWPAAGELDPGEDLWINVESYPQGAGVEGTVVFSTDAGETWQSVGLEKNGTQNNNDAWHVNLGAFARGETILFAAMIWGDNGEVWDSNGGENYEITVSRNVVPVEWVGGTHHWPEAGNVTSLDNLWINTASRPISAGFGGSVVYSADGGSTWQMMALSPNGTSEDADLWHVNLGTFAAGTEIQFALHVADEDGTETWDNNGGSNYVVTVSAPPSSLHWYGNTKSFGAPAPDVSIGTGPERNQLSLSELKNGVTYSLCRSTNLLNWIVVEQFAADSNAAHRALAELSSEGTGFYCLRVDRADGIGGIKANESVVVTIETWPAGGAAAANLIYSADGGESWMASPMVHVGTNGNNDVWNASIGVYPADTEIQYAIELLDDEGQAFWDNNNASNFVVRVEE